MFTPLINFGLGQLGGPLSPWKYMFICAGGVTVLWSFVVLFFLPGDPTRASGFSERERYIAVARLQSNNTGVRNVHFKGSQILDALSDLRFWLVIFIALLTMIANGPQSTFQAIIVNGFGFTPLVSLLLLTPFGFIIGTIQLVGPYLAFKYKNVRTYIVITCQCLTIISSLLLWLLPRSELGGLLLGVYFLGSFGGAYVTLMIIQVANTAGYTKRAFTSAGIFIAYSVGNVIGPLMFMSDDAPRYISGWTIVVVTQSTAAVLTLLYRILCVRENNRRDKTGIMESYDHAFDDDLTDRMVRYRDQNTEVTFTYLLILESSIPLRVLRYESEKRNLWGYTLRGFGEHSCDCTWRESEGERRRLLGWRERGVRRIAYISTIDIFFSSSKE